MVRDLFALAALVVLLPSLLLLSTGAMLPTNTGHDVVDLPGVSAAVVAQHPVVGIAR